MLFDVKWRRAACLAPSIICISNCAASAQLLFCLQSRRMCGLPLLSLYDAPPPPRFTPRCPHASPHTVQLLSPNGSLWTFNYIGADSAEFTYFIFGYMDTLVLMIGAWWCFVSVSGFMPTCPPAHPLACLPARPPVRLPSRPCTHPLAHLPAHRLPARPPARLPFRLPAHCHNMTAVLCMHACRPASSPPCSLACPPTRLPATTPWH